MFLHNHIHKHFSPKLISKNLFVSLLLLLFFTVQITAQNKNRKLDNYLKKQNKKEETGNFAEPRKNYENLLLKDSLNSAVNFALGMNYHYYSTDKRAKALFYFKKAAQAMLPDTIDEYLYFLAESEQFNEQYENAIFNYSRFIDKFLSKADNYLVKKEDIIEKIAQCKRALIDQKKQPRWKIEHLPASINTSYGEYTPIIINTNNKLIFNSRPQTSTGGKKSDLDNRFYEDIFITKQNEESLPTNALQKNEFLNKIINSKWHDAIVWKSENDSSLILYHSSNLFYSELKNESYSKPKKMFDLQPNDWYPHASINLKNKIVYFSYKNEDKTDNLDIFKGKLNDDGTVTSVQKMDSLINSNVDEDAPNYDANDNKLYFSSKKNSIGGFDVFVADLDSLGDAISVKSLNIPINSPGDDIYFINNYKYNCSYFSSSRAGGNGDMDIYKTFKIENTCVPFVNKEFIISLNATSSADNVGAKHYYLWEFDDNQKDTGLIVKHLFKRPGKHHINLNILDSITGRIEYKDKELDVDINNVDFIDINSIDTVIVDTETELSAEHCMLRNDSIINYSWSNGDDNFSESKNFKHIYRKTGKYCQNLSITSKQGHTFATAKTILVLSKNAYDSLIIDRKHKNDSIAKRDLTYVDFSNNSNNNNNINFSNPNKNNNPLSNKSVLKFENIYFDFDKYTIRRVDLDALDKIIIYMKENPDLQIQIIASCDSRGKNNYNYNLSIKRAKSTFNYLVSNGVSKTNIVGLINLGESALYNNCKDGVDCSEKLHQENRRAIINIIK